MMSILFGIILLRIISFCGILLCVMGSYIITKDILKENNSIYDLDETDLMGLILVILMILAFVVFGIVLIYSEELIS